MDFPTYEIVSRARHLRYLFLVENNWEGTKMIALIHHNMKIWGGRFNPIIPVINLEISDEWKALIRHYDPDYIGYTNGLSESIAISLCSELSLNPKEFINIDKGLHQIEGVPSQYLIPTIDLFFNEGLSFLQSSTIRSFESPLRDFYLINYVLDNNFTFTKEIIGSHTFLDVQPGDFSSLNSIISEHRIYNNTLLSATNTFTPILRSEKYFPNYFELIILRDYSSIFDLLYYWNRALYSAQTYIFSSLLITLDQIELLVADVNFKKLLDKVPTNDSRLNISSYSLNDEELAIVLGKLKGVTKQVDFRIKERSDFPYKIMDSSIQSNSYKEKPTIQIIPGKQHLIFCPSLSFNWLLRSTYHKWCINITITENIVGRNVKQFPLNTDPTAISNIHSRIDRQRQLVVFNDQSPWQLTIVSFFQNIRQVITNPRIINQPTKFIYDTCSINDAGNRLQQFLKLFQNNFNFVEEYIFDKFWSDLFYSLTNTLKVEGDTITFKAILEKCIAIFEEAGHWNTPEHSYRNEINLSKGLKKMLQELVDNKIFFPGFLIKCKSCASKIWYSLTEINETVICKGCAGKNSFNVESSISYKLNHLIKNNIGMRNAEGVFSPDGNLTVIKTLLHLENELHSNFEFLPQFDIYKDYRDEKPVTDLDIACLVNGKLYIGECKYSSSAFAAEGSKSLNNLLLISKTVNPDFIILSCTSDTNRRLEKSVQYLKHHLKNVVGSPDIISYVTREPDYFHLSGFKYFEV